MSCAATQEPGQSSTWGKANDPQTQVVGSYFTCVPVSPHSDTPFNVTDATFNAKPTAPSLDHVCAQQVSSNGLPSFLRVGVGNSKSFGARSSAAR